MSKILFLYMPTADQKMLPMPPLGIAVLAGYLRKKGHVVYLDDLEARTWDHDRFTIPFIRFFMRHIHLDHNNPKAVFKRKQMIKRYLHSSVIESTMLIRLHEWHSLIEPSIKDLEYVGFSVMERYQFSTSICFAHFLKQKYPHIKILFGGSFIAPSMQEWICSFEDIDLAVIGEGEVPLSMILERKEIDTIPNVISRNRSTSVKYESVYAEDMEPDFDGLPFDYYEKEPLILPYEMSKGCRNACTFCITHVKKQYSKPVDVVMQSLKRLKEKYQTDSFIIVDNAINVDIEFSKRLCKALIEEKLNIKWSAYFIPDTFEKDYITLLQEAGCVQLRLGIETADTKALNAMNKKLDCANIESGLQMLTHVGIWPHMLLIVGYIGETWKKYIKTLKFIIKTRKLFKSAVVSPLRFERAYLWERQNSSIDGLVHNGTFIQKRFLGLRYFVFQDINIALKIKVLYILLRLCKISYMYNFLRIKNASYRNHYLFAALRDAHSKTAKD